MDKILNFFKGKEDKKVTKIYKLPDNEKAIPYFDKIADRKLSEVLAENYRLKEQIAQLEGKLNKEGEKEFKELKEKAKQIYKIQKQLDKRSRVIFQLKIDNLPLFFLKSNSTYKDYKYFWGIELYETDDGYTIFYPLLTDGKNVVRFKKPATDILDFFKERIGVVKQLNSGKLDSNFDVNEYGKPVLLLDNEGKDVDSGTKVKIINLSEQERHKYELQISQLNDIINKLYSELEEAKKREVEYKQDLADKEMSLNVSQHEKEIANANLIAVTQKQMSMFKQLTDAMLSLEDVKLSQLLSEDTAKRLFETLQITKDKLDELEREAPQDYKQKVEDMYKAFMDKLNRLNTKINTLTNTPPGE